MTFRLVLLTSLLLILIPIVEAVFNITLLHSNASMGGSVGEFNSPVVDVDVSRFVRQQTERHAWSYLFFDETEIPFDARDVDSRRRRVWHSTTVGVDLFQSVWRSNAHWNARHSDRSLDESRRSLRDVQWIAVAIPTQIGLLTKLLRLDLSQCNYFGTIPAELRNLKQLLTNLELSYLKMLIGIDCESLNFIFLLF